MEYQIGDKVVHGTYGLGEIVQLDVKIISGKAASYYVVRVGELTIWVPQHTNGSSSLRRPTPARQFKKTISMLNRPGEPLSADRLQRKAQLAELLRDGSLESVCKVVRDLTRLGQSSRLNENDNLILHRAQTQLLNEWQVSLSVPLMQAEREMRQMLAVQPIPIDRKSVV